MSCTLYCFQRVRKTERNTTQINYRIVNSMSITTVQTKVTPHYTACVYIRNIPKEIHFHPLHDLSHQNGETEGT